MSEQNNVLQMKKLVAKMSNKTVSQIEGETIADMLDLIEDYYNPSPTQSTNLKTIDVTMEDISADDWSQSSSGMYYIDYKTYAELGLSNITPISMTTVDWSGLPYPFMPCITSTGIGITCEENMEFSFIKMRLAYIQNAAPTNLFNINGEVDVNYAGVKQNLNTVSNGAITTMANSTSNHSVGQLIDTVIGKKYSFKANVVSVGTGTAGYLGCYPFNSNDGTWKSGNVGEVQMTYTATTNKTLFGFETDGGTGAQFKDIEVKQID